MVEAITVLAEISRDYETIGEVEIRRCQHRLLKMQAKEKPLGTLHDVSLKRLWALAEKYDADSKQATLDSRFKSDTNEQKEQLAGNAQRLAALEDVCRNLFWVQAKDDIGSAAWESQTGVALRMDWLLVAGGQDETASTLAALLGLSSRPEGFK